MTILTAPDSKEPRVSWSSIVDSDIDRLDRDAGPSLPTLVEVNPSGRIGVDRWVQTLSRNGFSEGCASTCSCAG